MNDKTKVVYVVGASRSGSTIFDTILGNHDSVESVGELINAPRAWADEDEHCACGELAKSCGFWREVRNEWTKLTPGLPHEENWRAIQRKFERSRHIGRILIHGRKQSLDFQRYAHGVTELYRAIQRVSGKPVILDSSKNPIRALTLSYVNAIDLRLIHLVRDGRGVAWSFKKAYKKDAAKGVQQDLPSRPIARSAASWWLANTLAELAMKRIDSSKKGRLRYEDFVSHPQEMLKIVGGISGLSFQSVADKLAENKEFTVGHTVAGNRVRLLGKVKIQQDIEWVSGLSGGEKRLFWILAGHMARRYGYERSA